MNNICMNNIFEKCKKRKLFLINFLKFYIKGIILVICTSKKKKENIIQYNYNTKIKMKKHISYLLFTL